MYSFYFMLDENVFRLNINFVDRTRACNNWGARVFVCNCLPEVSKDAIKVLQTQSSKAFKPSGIMCVH